MMEGLDSEDGLGLELYVSFELSKEEMEANGILTHQIMKFSYRFDPDCPPYGKLIDVVYTDLERIIYKEFATKISFRYFKRNVEFDHQYIVKVMPTAFKERLTNRKILRPAQIAADNLLFAIVLKLGCSFVQLKPIITVNMPDFPSLWTVSLKKGVENSIITFTKDAVIDDSSSTFKVLIKGVRLYDILFFAEEIRLRRFHDSNLGNSRKCEDFLHVNSKQDPQEFVLALKTHLEKKCN